MSLQVSKGQTIDAQALRDKLTAAGYRHVQQVMEHGEFAVRGSILDLYPMGSPLPFRLDFFDDELDSIRHFDIETQRSSAKSMPLTYFLLTNSQPMLKT